MLLGGRVEPPGQEDRVALRVVRVSRPRLVEQVVGKHAGLRGDRRGHGGPVLAEGVAQAAK
eukprot:scaffold8504_cov77-Isochrysis_galbana.AAC.2